MTITAVAPAPRVSLAHSARPAPSPVGPLLLTLELAPACDECGADSGEPCLEPFCPGSFGAPASPRGGPAWL